MSVPPISRRQSLQWAASVGLGVSLAPFVRCQEADVLPETGREDPALGSLDELMRSFMAEHEPQGGSLAVSHGSRVVYSRGFGWADEARAKPVQPQSLFRIASISKPITAVAVLQLVEQGKLSLSDKIVDVLVLRNPGDPRWNDITLLHLLQHTAGFDRDASFDPMFRPTQIAESLGVSPPAEPWHIIEYMIQRNLDFTPGEKYAYSNFGYCLLGRAIEQVAGDTYESYVQQHVMKPVGVTRMRIGQTLQSGNDEVWYDEFGRTGRAVVGEIGSRVPQPYGSFYLEPMDSHGGWIASAEDLVRFAAAFDDAAKCPLLKQGTIDQMFAPPPGAVGHTAEGEVRDRFYACGWSIRRVNRNGAFNAFHSGSLSGTSTMLVRRHDGMNWAVLFSTRNNRRGQYLAGLIDPLIHRAVDAVRDWPS